MRRVVPTSLLMLAFLWACGGDSDPGSDGERVPSTTKSDEDEVEGDPANDAGSVDDAEVASVDPAIGATVPATPEAPATAPMVAGVGGAPIAGGSFGGSAGGDPDEGPSLGGGPPGWDDPECEGEEVTPLDWGACFWSTTVPFDGSAEGSFAGTITEVSSDAETSCFTREDASIVAGGGDCDNWNYDCRGVPSEGVTSVTVSDGDSTFELAWYVGGVDEVAVGDELEVRYVRDFVGDLGGYDHRQLSLLHLQRELFHIIQGPLRSSSLEDLLGLEARYGETACRTFGDFCDLRFTDVVFSSGDESTTLAIGETGFVQGVDVTFVAGPQLSDPGACHGTTHHTFAFTLHRASPHLEPLHSRC